MTARCKLATRSAPSTPISDVLQNCEIFLCCRVVSLLTPRLGWDYNPEAVGSGIIVAREDISPVSPRGHLRTEMFRPTRGSIHRVRLSPGLCPRLQWLGCTFVHIMSAYTLTEEAAHSHLCTVDIIISVSVDSSLTEAFCELLCTAFWYFQQFPFFFIAKHKRRQNSAALLLPQQDALVAAAMFVLLIRCLMEEAQHDESQAVAKSGFQKKENKDTKNN